MLPAKSLDIFSGTEDEENSRENVLREIYRPTIMERWHKMGWQMAFLLSTLFYA